ncbi:MAG: ArsA family ATPase [Oligoflexia bacterium]|nr:ArsA family ATPase [Oligoflexia bacterium]
MSRTRVAICCGSGGVGKTTISAALALKWALAGQRVAVLTIDPARRLADSLSIGQIGNTAVRVPIEQLSPQTTGHLDAMMLDAKATFDDLVRRFATSDSAASRILANRYYQFASTRLGGSHEYMAMERLYDLWHNGDYDVVVLDTPPTRNALDFLRAPDRMASLMDEGVLRWLVMPASRSGWRALELGSEVLSRVLKKVMGRGTVSEIAEFFEIFRDLWDGFHARSVEVRSLLRDPMTTFLLVSSPAPAARADALYFLDQLAQKQLPFGGFVVNRTLTPPLPRLDPAVLPAKGPLPPERWDQVLDTIRQARTLRQRLAKAHAEAIAQLRKAGPQQAPCWLVPEQAHDLHDLGGLATITQSLPSLPDIHGQT